MRWWEMKIRVPHETAEAMSALLQEWPEVQGVAMEGVFPGGPPALDTGEWFPEELLHPEAVDVLVYLPEDVPEPEVRARLSGVCARIMQVGLPLGGSEPSLRLVDESSWENAWKEHYHTMPVGERLVIIPKWEQDEVTLSGRLPIVMEPGMAFGTGTHATTQLCLEALEQMLRPGDVVADVGCGTAILSIAAAKLGASRVIAIDIDPVAVKVARENAADNGVGSVIEVVQGNLLQALAPDAQCEGMVANILRDAVIQLAPQAYTRLREDGWFVVSGFILSQEEAVRTALEQAGFVVVHAWMRDDWVALGARKRP